MKNLLNLKIGEELFIKKDAFLIINVENFLQKNKKAVRYILQNKRRKLILEIKREFALNYQLFCYELIESFPYNQSFISILGTNSLGLNNPKISKNKIFSKINLKNKEYNLIKHIITEDELPSDYQQKGYHKDMYGNWYFFTKKYAPIQRKYNNSKEKEFVWEYKQEGNIRLLITSNVDKKSHIMLFKGSELWISEVTTMSSKTSLQSQKANPPYFSQSI